MVRRLGLLFVVGILFVSGCGAGGGGTTPAAQAPKASSAPLDFSATTLDGKAFDGRSLAGKPVLLWFWAPWCPVCLQQAPGVRAAAERFGDRVAVVGVAGLDKAEAMPEFVRLAKIESITNLSDEPGVVWKHFGITAQSTFVLIDASGRVTGHGTLQPDEIPDRVAALLESR
ncbi:TlpA family protein disulfide reductase [Dactylosporangium matsuzakiense]|uniref:Thiol:disulfide interchange protein n=1 Tax=Dactylosporangium matsuzakiense TaxID=53360 RepID=A0A9W6KPQ3_9ACTN|nr:redoxin domain-containing protein [Dactylosporangium matsuzakiense]UWZ42350.1 redoxin domain-containing protein [Dactylosporangium matsuzakiense]GLL05273.1 thiol:disulfide interchange protein [Dactylosporangium matsuzakiense]